MKFTSIAIAAVFLAGHINDATADITADELARFLGVSSWKTIVDLPPQSFTIQIYTIDNGEVADAVFPAPGLIPKKEDTAITILCGPTDGKYRFTVSYAGGGTYGTTPPIAMFPQTSSPSLPAKVKEGDFVLFGQRAVPDQGLPSEDIHSYSRGFLLRIEKAAQQGAAANP